MRVAFVVQRYGTEVHGGAETLCRWVAERMHKYFDVEVLTTCALDYLTWENHFPAETTAVNGVPVRRFPTDAPRDMQKFNAFARTLFARECRTIPEELTWIQMQGPASSALLDYIKAEEDHYDLFVFMTYSYLTTFLGLQLVPRKSLLIPAAHDEPHFYFTAFQPIFHLPQGILYNTNEERRLVQTQWN
ncbi:glycosyltransferase family 1 protein, partial [candidate division KSB3 bacterium]|nr:glycosyltransferase family 1 protein [candidate division KSB3 bacterium]MBD3326573.1 glycosyltransferase family 1 protein [candidate division KSB3 bacterium]